MITEKLINIVLEITKNIYRGTTFLYLMIKLYMHVYIMRLINYVLRSMGYTRIYDLDTGDDLTIFYHIIKLLPTLNLPLSFDVTYQRLGICTYINKNYVRYVCYDTKLSNAVKTEKEISSKHYHSVKKIELIYLTHKDLVSDNTSDNISEDSSEDICISKRIDMTASKHQLYDVGNFTRPNDIIRFYQIMNNIFKTYDTYDKYMLENIKSIYIHREYFDEDLVEFVNSYEEVYIETN